MRTNGSAAGRSGVGSPKAYQDKPIYVFETGGTTGIPKSRVVVEDHWIDYELFSDTLPDESFPKGSQLDDARPVGARGGCVWRSSIWPITAAASASASISIRGGSSNCSRTATSPGVKAYADHVIDQAMTILSAGHDIKCMFATPKLLEALALRLMNEGSSVEEAGIKGIFAGGTEFTPQWYRFCREELLGPNVYITPTYGNTLMGLACGKPFDPADNYKITYYAPEPRAVIEVVDFDDHTKVVHYGESGRVKLYTLTKEVFIPGFLERDEGEREKPHEKYPWDGVSGVKPFREFAKTTTVGVY